LSAWCAPTAHRYFIAYLRNARSLAGISFVRLIFILLTAQKISVIKIGTDKNSCHNFTRLSAWCAPTAHGYFVAYLQNARSLAGISFVRLIFILLPRRKSQLSDCVRTKTPVAISRDYLLGVRQRRITISS